MTESEDKIVFRDNDKDTAIKGKIIEPEYGDDFITILKEGKKISVAKNRIVCIEKEQE